MEEKHKIMNMEDAFEKNGFYLGEKLKIQHENHTSVDFFCLSVHVTMYTPVEMCKIHI